MIRSQAEYIPPTSPAAEIANNPYYKRDMRRAFPVALVFENPTANL